MTTDFHPSHPIHLLFNHKLIVKFICQTCIVAPQIVPFVIGDEPANSGDGVAATCAVFKGDFPIDIEWSLNGEPLSRDYPDVTISSTSKRVSVLTIDAVSARHAGEYTCTASNAAGGTSYTTSLAVNGRSDR